LSLALGFWAWRKNRDVLAGLALVPALIKPDLALIPILLLCGFALRERRWRMLGAFVGGGLALLMGSFAINGFWPPRWLDALGRYADYAQTVWPIGAAFEIQPLLGVVLIVVVGLALWRLRPHPISLFSLAVALGMLLLPQTPIWGQTLLLLPLALSGTRRGRWAVLGVWLAGWLLALLTTGNPGGWRLVTILLPVLTIGAVSLSSPDTPPEPAMHKQS
jgi:hypothetical protein